MPLAMAYHSTLITIIMITTTTADLFHSLGHLKKIYVLEPMIMGENTTDLYGSCIFIILV